MKAFFYTLAGFSFFGALVVAGASIALNITGLAGFALALLACSVAGLYFGDQA